MMNVLIVEDDLMIADLLEESLLDAGFSVCAIASSASTAVAAARQFRPELAVIDVNLGGGGSGTSVPALLQADWPLGILFASGNDIEADAAEPAGIGLLLKPYTLHDMVTSVNIVGDIVTTGATQRPLPPGLRLLQGQATP